MSFKYLWIIVVTACLLVGLYHIFAAGSFSYPEYNLRAGQVSDIELIAPFDFPILKSAELLSKEQKQNLQNILTPYRFDDEALFSALSALDKLWAVLYANPQANSAQKAQTATAQGFRLQEADLAFATNLETLNSTYNKLRAALEAIYERGIYSDIDSDSICVYIQDVPQIKPASYYLQPEEALAELIRRVPEAESLLQSLKDDFVNSNLEVDEQILGELTRKSISEIPETEGMVLQNEVIIRKNARVSERDIIKLESLQSAYRYRNLHKSPTKQLLLALGMFLYSFLILLLANHYYEVNSKDAPQSALDFFPINMGFILIVVFGIITNSLFGINNLLIPFALTVVSAAILIGLDFGLLYGVCSMLLLNPFINWESYTPVIFILSTALVLLMIRRQKSQPDYLYIWFFLLIANTVVNLALSIYKSDPIFILFRNIGFGILSSALSVAGISVIVPYYERRWQRATRKTLLELQDFNHPLLKQLATTAVGTYHHSLIVGNLAERAAEAIGANTTLARVGSYYHDIGKIVNTDSFTENNEHSGEIHDAKSPAESAQIIKNHVIEGVKLAKAHNIPQPVIDILMQHHGKGLIRYFYDKAEKQNMEINPEEYQYPGPRPQSKEAVLVMIADVLESTIRSKNIQNEAEIRKIIDETIARLLREGQFDEAPITMKELNLIKQPMLPVLGSINRKRLDYPETHDKS